MNIANSTYLYLTVSHLLASPFFIQSSSSNIQQITFERSSFNHFFKNFYYSTASFTKNFKGQKFEMVLFTNFLDSPIKIEGINIENTTHTEQKAVSIYSDVFISYCVFKNCHSRSGSGGGLSITTPTSVVKDTSNSIKFQLISSTFYNCSSISGGGIFVQFNGDIEISNVCFNNCEAKVSNQAGFIDVSGVQPSSAMRISFTSIFRCPSSSSSSLSAHRGLKNCFHIKGDDLLINLECINSTYNQNNNDRGSVLTLTGLNRAEMKFSIIMNNDGSDGFSLLRVSYFLIGQCQIINNSFSIAPFNTYGSITVTTTYEISLYSVQLINNNVTNSRNITSSIVIYLCDCIIEPNDEESQFGIGNVHVISNNYNCITFGKDFDGTIFFPDSCFLIQPSTTVPVHKSKQSSLDLIIYSLIGACCLIIISLTTILIIYCTNKKRKIKKWIEENESSSKQNSSISTSTFVEPLLDHKD